MTTDRRVPQITDSVQVTIVLPPQTEEWVEDALAEEYMVRRADYGVVIRTVIHGNTSGLACAADVVQDLEERLADVEIDVMEFAVTVVALPPDAALDRAGRESTTPGRENCHMPRYKGRVGHVSPPREGAGPIDLGEVEGANKDDALRRLIAANPGHKGTYEVRHTSVPTAVPGPGPTLH